MIQKLKAINYEFIIYGIIIVISLLTAAMLLGAVHNAPFNDLLEVVR